MVDKYLGPFLVPIEISLGDAAPEPLGIGDTAVVEAAVLFEGLDVGTPGDVVRGREDLCLLQGLEVVVFHRECARSCLQQVHQDNRSSRSQNQIFSVSFSFHFADTRQGGRGAEDVKGGSCEEEEEDDKILRERFAHQWLIFQ